MSSIKLIANVIGSTLRVTFQILAQGKAVASGNAELFGELLKQFLPPREVAQEGDRPCRNLEALRVLLDFKGVQRIDSSTLGKLITMNRLMKLAKCPFALCDLNQMEDMFEIAKLDEFFPIYQNAAEALAADLWTAVKLEKRRLE